jgi:hypothetical protein
MAYGLEVKSTIDASIIISSEQQQTFFIGKAIYVSNDAYYYQYASTPFYSYVYHYEIVCDAMPILFIQVMAGHYQRLYGGYYSGGKAYIKVYENIKNTESITPTVPDIYCFETKYLAASYADDFGLKITDAEVPPNVIYDSRAGLKILSMKKFDAVSLIPDRTFSVTGITKPAIALSPMYIKTYYKIITNQRYMYETDHIYNILSGSTILFPARSTFSPEPLIHTKNFTGNATQVVRMLTIEGTEYD